MPTSRRAFLKSVSAAVGAASLSVAGIDADAEAKMGKARETTARAGSEKLWYSKPASQWLEALPIGNGRISAMVFGGTDRERLQLNEGTLWAGSPHDYTSPDGLAALPEIRKLVFAGKWNEAQHLVDSKFMGRPAGQCPYQTVGELILTFPNGNDTTDYRRELDLSTAITTTSYASGGVRYTREAFASAPHNVIAVRIGADKPGSISLKARFEGQLQFRTHSESADTLSLTGMNSGSGGIRGGVQYHSSVKVAAVGGKVTAGPDQLEVAGADSVVLTISIATSYIDWMNVSGNPEQRVGTTLRAALPFDRLRKEHLADYQKLYKRVSLSIGDSTGPDTPTNERVEKYHEGGDPQLAALHFQYGRYLLISCSRPGGQPATLQGLWNDSVSPPWGSKYTININTEMNYWPAGPTNLAECYSPLLQMLKELSEAGKRAATGLYGAKGWVCHHNTDAWRGTSPVDASFYGMWPMGGAWLCKNLWDLYEYTYDIKLLKESYPILKEAAVFFLDTLVEEPSHGWLVTCPSISPEHGHHPGVSICAGPTMDIQILNDLFHTCIKSSEILNEDPDPARQMETRAQSKFPPMQIGKEEQSCFQGVVGRLGHDCGRHPSSACFASLRLVSVRSDHETPHSRSVRRGPKVVRYSRRHFHGLEPGMEDQPLGEAGGGRSSA